MKKLVSIVVPCYNEEKALPIFIAELNIVLDTMNYASEIILINDGSQDNTLSIIKKLAAEYVNIKYISFSRNFGKEAAMYAGLTNSRGDYVAVMDADMQDPPALLPNMLQIIENQDYDSVATRRVNRIGDPLIRSWFARKFYKLINKISDADVVDGARDYRLMKKDMVDAIVSIEEYNRFSKGIFGWVGYNTYWLPYENVERVAGETKWNFWGLFKYAIDGLVNFSQVPLRISSWFGITMTGMSFLALIVVCVKKLVWGDPVAGWASLICVIVFIGGIQLLCLGIMGQYIAKMYMETKNRPHCIIKETNIEGIEKVL